MTVSATETARMLRRAGERALAAGDAAAARASLARARALAPCDPAILRALALALARCGDDGAALALIAEGLAAMPADAMLHAHAGEILQRRGARDAARDAYDRALTLGARDPAIRINLATLLASARLLGEAERVLRAALAEAPGAALAHHNLGYVLLEMQRLAEAEAAYDRALACDPDLVDAQVQRALCRAMRADWRHRDEDLTLFDRLARTAPARLDPFLAIAFLDDPALHGATARARAREVAALAGAALPPAPRRAARPARLTIGYLSADFHAHATTQLLVETLERHDRTRFAIRAYCIGIEDGSALRKRLRSAVDGFVPLAGASHRDAAARIRADGVDVLVDLKAYTRLARPEILALRPAPVQVAWLGFPGTTGAPWIDYAIVNPIVLPPAAAIDWTEAPVWLPQVYQPNDRARAVASPPPSRLALGLPARGFVFCSFNAMFKLTPALFDAWMAALAATEGAVLWLLSGDAGAADHLREAAAARGIDPARLVFAPRLAPEAHLARLAAADLFLDTLPCGAHTTASEALWMGVPVLTCRGRSFAGRVAASLVAAVGLPDLAVDDLAAYTARAIAIARDPALHRTLVARLAAARATAPLFDAAARAREVEAACDRMIARHVAGLPPIGFAVPAAPPPP